MTTHSSKPRVLIIGAGPAGLTASYELGSQGVTNIVLEQDSTVGGLSRTVSYKDYLFDIGGHRFFTKVEMVEQLWRTVLGADLLARPRLSRIYYHGKFFHYPLQPMDALLGLGPWEALRCGLSYLQRRLRPRMPEEDLESWISNRFGDRLFQIFFKTYTEKVWGIPCNRIHAEWAAQRIRGLSLGSLLRDMLRPQVNGNGKGEIRTLIKQFQYPRKGPGMFWGRMKELIEKQGSHVVFNAPVKAIHWGDDGVAAVEAGGSTYEADFVISSMPVRELLERLTPAPEPEVLSAARDFHYRDFLTVALILDKADLFPDNWVYIHDPTVRVGRIQNYKNWSPEMVPDSHHTCLGLEYFCNEGDSLWALPDKELHQLARREIAQLGLTGGGNVIDGTVLRVKKAYPVYDQSYRNGLEKVRQFLRRTPNLQLIGRNGMHRYNNQDHSMLTGILAARNILGANYDLWQVNVEAEHLEQGAAISQQDLEAMNGTQPTVPRRLNDASFGPSGERAGAAQGAGR